MAGQFAADAEVSGGAHEAGAEEFLPKTVHLHAGGERMLGAQQPLGKAHAIARQVGGHRRQAGGRGGLHGVAALIVFPAGKDVGHRRLALLVHDVGDGSAALDSVLFLLQFGGAGSGVLPRLVVHGQPPVVERIAFGIGALIGGFGENAAVFLRVRQGGDFARTEQAGIEAHVLETEALNARLLVALAEFERQFVVDRAFEIVRLVVGLELLAVEIDLHAVGLAAAVVGDENVVPFVRRERFPAYHFNSILIPGADDVGAGAVALHPQIPAAIARAFLDAGHGRAGDAIARQAHPRAVGEGLVVLESICVRHGHSLARLHLEGLGGDDPGHAAHARPAR